MQRERLPYILIPIAAFLAVLPLLINGCSCGHDFDFHLLNWLEAAKQFTHGNLHPHWAHTPAYNAGEPRFVFYPPLSWTLGAILSLIFRWTWTPILYTWFALTSAGLALFHLARNFTPTTAATLAAVLYMVNPYMLFTAYERTAYAELLASAIIPLLLHAILRDRVTIPSIAIPIALLWLTNAPAAVMSCYVLALLTIIRIVTTKGDLIGGLSRASATDLSSNQPDSTTVPQTRLQLALNTIFGTILGLGLAAFYIVPADYQRRYVQISMATNIPIYQIQNNFLFRHTSDAAHDQVLHTASIIALILIAATAIALAISSRLQPTNTSPQLNPEHSQRAAEGLPHLPNILLMLTILTITITLLLTPITQFVWNHTPELAFLQFPWRLLAILAPVLALTIALALTPIRLKPAATTTLSLIVASALTYPAYKLFHQPCDPEDTPQAVLAVFGSNQGTDPIDEYTPITADIDSLAHANPPYWLSTNPNAPAPAGSLQGPAPTHLTIDSPAAQTLILNLRNYPAWKIFINGTVTATQLQRDDGLITIPVPAGSSTLDITYTQSLDQTAGDIITLISLALLVILVFTSRRALTLFIRH